MSVIRSRPSPLILLESSNAPQVYVIDQHDPAIHSGKRLSSKTELFYFHLLRREDRRRERVARQSLLLAPAQPQLSATTAITGIQSLLFPAINPAETGITMPPSSPALDKPVPSHPPLYQKVGVLAPTPTPTPTPALVHTCAPSPAPAPTGRVLNVADFDIYEKLGQGGFGMVYRATDKMTGVELALKIMPKKTSRFRFVQDEHRAMRAVEGMPGFVQLYASWHDTVNYYLAMQFVPYGDVKHKVSFQNPIPVDFARVWMAELLVLLSELHVKGLVHRDIKPDNLLVDGKGHIVLADFGLTRDFKLIPYDIHPSDPRAPTVLPRSPYAAGETPIGFSHQRYGTPQYFAPELHLGWAYSYGTDIWSAGVTLFFMVFGRIPFNSADIKSVGNAIVNKPLRFTQAEQHWDEFANVRDLLTRMLAKDPAERPSVEQIKAHPFFSTINWKAMSAHNGPSAWKRPPLPRPRPNISERAAIPFTYGKSYTQDEDPWPSFTFTAAALQRKIPCFSTFTCVRKFFSRTFEPKSTPQSACPVPSAGNATSSRSLRRVEIAAAFRGEIPTGDICDEVRTALCVPKMKDRVGGRHRAQVKWFR